MSLREPVTLNTGFWNPKNFYGLVQQVGPWPNQAIDNEKRRPQPLPAGVVGKGGSLHAGHNYWELDTTFMSDIHTLGDTGSLKYHHAPALIKGKPFVGGGASLRRVPKKKKTFLDPNTLAHFAQLAEFLGKYPGDGQPKDADIKTEKLKSPSEPLGGLGTFDKEEKNIGTSPYLSPVKLNIPGIENLTQTSPKYVSESFNQTSPNLISNSWAQTSPIKPTDVIMVDEKGIQVATPTVSPKGVMDFFSQFSPETKDFFQYFRSTGKDIETQTPIDKKAQRELNIKKGLMEKVFRVNRKDFGGTPAKRFQKGEVEVMDVAVKPDGTITNNPSEFTTNYWDSVEREATELSHFTNVLAANEARRNASNTRQDVDETSTMVGSPTESLRGMAIPEVVSTPIVVSNGIVDSRRPNRVMGQIRKPPVKPKKTIKINTKAVAGPSKPSLDTDKKFEIISPSDISITPTGALPKTPTTPTLPLPPKPKRKYTKKVVSAEGSIAGRLRSKKNR